jgi:hypothetical protein
MRLRFAIRDLLWLAVVVALAVGRWIDHRDLIEHPIIIQIGGEQEVVHEEQSADLPSQPHIDEKPLGGGRY